MASLALSHDPKEGCADLVFGTGGLALDDGLASLALASLLTDARSPAPGHRDDPRGWWGDALPGEGAAGGTPWGGLLWTLAREKTTPEVLRLAEDHARAALDWMIADGIAARIEVSATRLDRAGSGAVLRLAIDIHRPDGGTGQVLFDRLWDGLAGGAP